MTTKVNLFATVTVTGTGTLTALVNGVTTTVRNALPVTAAVNDVVMVSKIGAEWWATSRLYAAPPPKESDGGSPPNPNTSPGSTAGELVVSPVETRSYRPNYGWRTDNTNVYQGEYGGWGNHTGCAFYGSKPRSLDGATVAKATIKVRRPAGTGETYGAASTTLWLVTQSTRPSGAPTRTSSTSGPSIKAGESATFTIPTSWAQSMVDGTAGGLALFESDGDPYVIYAGRGTWSPAFTLTIEYTR